MAQRRRHKSPGATPSAGNALVTGAAQRIGRAIAKELARAGWAVAVHYHRSAADARSLVAEIADSGGTAVAIAADLGKANAAASLIGAAAKALGPLTLLVNNAAIFERDTIATADAKSFDRHAAVNLRAPLLLSQAFARQLAGDAAGNIVNLVDAQVWRTDADFISYNLSKAGLWSLTRNLALALAPRVRVNAIGPGAALPSARQSPAHFARQWSSTPLGRGAHPGEIAQAIAFIVAAPAMTGQMIALDGGQHLVASPPLRGETDDRAGRQQKSRSK
jgi:NAD(P)-dependent dehydrogenase (short-subunit alcohol dehydrogenase family)